MEDEKDLEFELDDDAVLRSITRKLSEKGDRFFCPTCNVKYTKFKYLKTHMKHCGLPFKCEFCKQVYKQKRTYSLHLKTKHSHEEEMVEEYLEI